MGSFDVYDVAIVGAGVVGCAVAREFARLGRRVLVLERRDGPGLETSQYNSGVIHSGIHLQPAFLKARFAREGSGMVVRYCREHGVPIRQVGMHIVVAARDLPGLWTETTNLREMLRRAKRQGIRVELLTAGQVRKREPAIRCVFGLRIPEVHVIDPQAFVAALHADATTAGATFRFTEDVNFTFPLDGAKLWALHTTQQVYAARLVVNAAGLEAEVIALSTGHVVRQYYYRGEYYEVTRPDLRVSSLVYPVFKPGDPGLGIHLTPTVDGRLLVGPNARRVERNTDYDVDPTPPEAFHAAVARFLPDLRVGDLRRVHAGIRPKLTAERRENDFHVEFRDGNDPYPPIVHLVGIESPGLTASLALARFVREGVSARSYL